MRDRDRTLAQEKSDRFEENDLRLEDLGGSEPQVHDIPRRRYEM